MQEQVTAFIKKHQLISKNTTVLLGVSGGPDSMALLHYFQSIRKKWNLNLIVLSADHQLRGEGGRQDLDYVERVCEQQAIQFVGTSLNVNEYKHSHGVGTQVAARELRYQFYGEQMKKQAADYLALGHHGDDQIETMLMEISRTADSSSFSGIPVKRPFASGQIIRPFLCITKHEIEMYCQSHGIYPKIDPSNRETTYTRNYYRKYVVPRLKERNRKLHTTVQHLSETLHDDEQFLIQEAEKMIRQVVTFHTNERKIFFNNKAFKSYPTALQRRAYHLILNYLYDKLPDTLSYIHESYFFGLLNRNNNVEIDFPKSLKVQKSYERVILYFDCLDGRVLSFHEVIPVPGKVNLPDGGQISATYTKQQNGGNNYTFFIPTENLQLPLHIRTRRDGDRMSWKGLNGSKKVKDVFIDEKIPVNHRNAWPIVTDNQGTILWLIGLRKRQFSHTQSNNDMIKLTYENNSSL